MTWADEIEAKAAAALAAKRDYEKQVQRGASRAGYERSRIAEELYRRFEVEPVSRDKGEVKRAQMLLSKIEKMLDPTIVETSGLHHGGDAEVVPEDDAEDVPEGAPYASGAASIDPLSGDGEDDGMDRV